MIVVKKIIACLCLLLIFSCTTIETTTEVNEPITNLFIGKISYNGSDFRNESLNGVYFDNITVIIENIKTKKIYSLKTENNIFVGKNIFPGEYRIKALKIKIGNEIMDSAASFFVIPYGEFTILPDTINISGRMYWNCKPNQRPLFVTNIEYATVKEPAEEYVKNNNLDIKKWNYVHMKQPF